MMKTKRTFALLSVFIGLLLGSDALAFYNPSTGRWLSRDPIQEVGGLNLYAFVRNIPVAHRDALGQADTTEPCYECGVKNAKMKVPGITFEASRFFFHVFEEVSYKKGLKYDPNCCVVFQYQKSTVLKNGVPITTASSGGPLDGQWHLDSNPWHGDEISQDGGMPGGLVSSSGDTSIWSDEPGWNAIEDGTQFSFKVQLRIVVKDSCHKWKTRASSNTITLTADGVWPDIHYTHTRTD